MYRISTFYYLNSFTTYICILFLGRKEIKCSIGSIAGISFFFFNRVFVIIPKWDLLHELLQSSNQVATDLFNQAGPSYSEDRNPDGVWSNKLATSLLQVCYNLYEIRRAAGPISDPMFGLVFNFWSNVCFFNFWSDVCFNSIPSCTRLPNS